MAHNNADDATRDGAYSISLAVTEVELGLVAIGRAETRTGADYYAAPIGVQDFEQAYRLEVSGLDRGNKSDINRRLREKVQQAHSGKSNLPAIASVVGFLHRTVLIERVDEG